MALEARGSAFLLEHALPRGLQGQVLFVLQGSSRERRKERLNETHR